MNSTQSGTVNISVKVANPTTTPITTTLTTTISPSTGVITSQPTLSINILIIFGLALHYLMTAYAVNDPLFPLHKNYQIPPKGLKATIWKLRSFPLMIAFLTGLYGLIMARTFIIFLYNLITWYFIFIEYILPRKK